MNLQLLKQLGKISVSTVRRTLQRIGQDQPRLVRQRPVQRRSYQQIPARRLVWNLKEPGHFEVDLVHHCGESSSGQYVCTLQMIDVATGWSERVAVLGRSYLVIRDAFQRILRRLPFAVCELHPDNGSEFLNHHLLRYCPQAMPGLEVSRSRPNLLVPCWRDTHRWVLSHHTRRHRSTACRSGYSPITE